MSPRRPAPVRPVRRAAPTPRDTSVPTSAWLQPITYVYVIASLGAAALTKESAVALAAALHLT